MVALLHPPSRNPSRTADRNAVPTDRAVVDDRAVSGADNPVVAVAQPLQLVVDNGPVAPRRMGGSRAAGRPLRRQALDRRGRSPVRSVPANPVPVGILAVAALLVFGGLLLVRLSQGTPPADTWDGLERVSVQDRSPGEPAPGAAAAATLQSGDRLIRAQAGDSMWSIAQRLSPETDPRPIVAALVEANGGDSVQIGQQIVIPEQLLD